MAGDPAAARGQFAPQLPLLQRVLGPEHPQTMTARTSRGRWTGVVGDAPPAAGARLDG